MNQGILAKQRGVAKDAIRKAASALMHGNSIISVSLPVRIFEPRSLLERICDWYGFAPVYLKEAGLFKDPLERFKNCIAFSLSSLYVTVKQLKPFNPILGETF